MTRLVEKAMFEMFSAGTWGFQGRCFSDHCAHDGAVATLVTTSSRGRKSYRLVCERHAARHRTTELP